ncbi:terpene cyclase [Steccherinum ochraceum]|uniref:Terpene synthase n=1 Tax=Steccherinum ochraceum TaxID=92696 RepID=A0A4R0R6M2_9APHY|nr:terpene cyclase [Steccherinum ochraceum]
MAVRVNDKRSNDMSQAALPKMLYLPDTLVNWPWPRAINPHHEEVKAASNAWFHSFNAFNPKSQYAFDKCDFGLLAALAYPRASPEHLRTGCDLMNFFFLIDEYTDVEPAPVVREIAGIVIDAMTHPNKPRPEGETVVGEAARQFWSLAVKSASAPAQKHMIEAFTDYLNSVVQQAIDRDSDTCNTVEEYLHKRRQNIGIRPSFVPIELGLNLTDDVFYHPVIDQLRLYVGDMVILDNDMASYNKEQAMGDDRYNIITVVMRQFNTDFDGANHWVTKYHDELKANFLRTLTHVPSFGDQDKDAQVQMYLYGLANWPRCNVCWNFESGRYFGSKGLEFQETRMVPLLPKVEEDTKVGLCGEAVVIPLVDELAAAL